MAAQPPLRAPCPFGENRIKTLLRDLPLLFVYFQVNNGVLYVLAYVEDIYIRVLSLLVSIINPYHLPSIIVLNTCDDYGYVVLYYMVL